MPARIETNQRLLEGRRNLDLPGWELAVPVSCRRFHRRHDRLLVLRGASEFGIELVGPLPHYRFLYPIAPEALRDLAYDFEYRHLDGRDPSTSTRGLADAVQRWRELSGRAAESLIYRRGPGFLFVQDRRPGLEAADFHFDRIEAKIYLACDAGATAAEIHAQLAADGENSLDALEIETYLQELVYAGLMFREGSRFLALAIAINGSGASFEVPAHEVSTSALPVICG
jgi:hypothetical protein